ncbi:MAG TPA: beta-ketoacyl synthase N-terminal-like domain-containing protein, partial [Tepidisphaeraceae bacterium]|nr:beta-ketoacyl synthase N-terminal-like domain-containing protein [Tepidisphaeraceae bacterium]
RGPSHVITTGCASSSDAIAYAMLLIRAGIVSAVVVGGADAPISHGALFAFEKMKVVSTRKWDHPAQSSRPFSADRDGFVLGEGAWMMVLEDADHAEARHAQPIAEILGSGSTCDAYHRVQIAPDLAECVRAIGIACDDADVSADEIEYVNRVFGPCAPHIPMSATKSMIGHPQGACGAAGVAATILCLRQRKLHPTINLHMPDPACDLDYVANVSRDSDATLALCNCIAFGSKNSALVLRVLR